jgi:hypothetical protein
MGDGWINVGMPYDTSSANISAAYLPAITNILQLLTSAVRLDMGLALPNNPYLVPSIANKTLPNPFPKDDADDSKTWGHEMDILSDPGNMAAYSLNVFLQGRPAFLNAEYLCRFLYPKYWGESFSHQ